MTSTGTTVWVDRIARLLAARPGLSAREIAGALRTDRTTVNQALYSHTARFARVGDAPPRWNVRSSAGVAVERAKEIVERVPLVPAMSQRARDAATTALYSWQEEALTAWRANGRRGIIEAVTGAGKTRLGLRAASEVHAAGGSVVVVVPTVDLLHQWHGQLVAELGAPVGMLGDGSYDTLRRHRAIVATVQSARNNPFRLAPGTQGLLIADEVHRFAGEVNRLGLDPEFEFRMGLSATYERQDGLHEDVLLPYFDGLVYSLGYGRASRDGVIAGIRVALIGVDLLPQERAKLEEYDEIVSAAWSRLVRGFGVTPEPYQRFISEVQAMVDGGTRQEGIAAGRYMKAVGDRRRLLAETPQKLAALTALRGAIEDADRTLVFTTTIASADVIADRLVGLGRSAAAHHSRIDRDDRRSRLQRFGEGELEVLTTAQTLNEGIDVPAADLGVIFGGSRQRREMVQRMGRVLRRKPDGRDARFAVLYVRGSAEDPSRGFQEEFLADITAVAKATKSFALDGSHELRSFLYP